MGFQETLEMARGETPAMSITVYQDDDETIVFPLTGYSATLYIREDASDSSSYLFSIIGTIALPLTGVIVFQFLKTHTASLVESMCKDYYFDARIDDGVGGHEYSIARGTLTVLATAKKKT